MVRCDRKLFELFEPKRLEVSLPIFGQLTMQTMIILLSFSNISSFNIFSTNVYAAYYGIHCNSTFLSGLLHDMIFYISGFLGHHERGVCGTEVPSGSGVQGQSPGRGSGRKSAEADDILGLNAYVT